MNSQKAFDGLETGLPEQPKEAASPLFISVTISSSEAKQIPREPSASFIDALAAVESNGTMVSGASGSLDAKSGFTVVEPKDDAEGLDFAASDSFDSDYELLADHIYDSKREARAAASTGQFFGQQPEATTAEAAGHLLPPSNLASVSLPMDAVLRSSHGRNNSLGRGAILGAPQNTSQTPGSWPPGGQLGAFWTTIPGRRHEMPDLRRYWRSFGGTDKLLD
jgi:hypothetical protein